MDRIESLISELTLEEKFQFSLDLPWHTTAVPRLNIPRVKMTDGPIGAEETLYQGNSSRFPSASCLSSTWDKESVQNIAKAIGIEARSKDAGRFL